MAGDAHSWTTAANLGRSGIWRLTGRGRMHESTTKPASEAAWIAWWNVLLQPLGTTICLGSGEGGERARQNRSICDCGGSPV